MQHRVLVCPQFTTGVFTISKTVYRAVCGGEGVSCVVVVTYLDSGFPGRTIVAIIESTVGNDQIGRPLTVQQNSLAIRVERAAATSLLGAL